MSHLSALALAMTDFDKGSPGLINHFLKVTAYARIIAETEALPPETVELITAAALTHDIGIPIAMENTIRKSLVI